ncbi:signal recognition particle subunit SRP68 [Sporothrix brasiliensis 5110]|uniref:Signal recognition particle subunit SRP68 n=1 Tax=Sporothrix brasiliensis 5110 TaxID=1398154 RepID=A0A0C2EUI1_9PEZI|nr:signal recognition particle subunit SRP68 [Sporothrix brasiliensis 5110]KIH90194.1 signal recognition particle subunit SRP68 [Sporothrix brasiliensis 5110]
MDITQFVVSSRDKALLYGDYSTYRTQLAHRLLNIRKKLRVATRHRGKYNHNANNITAEQVAADVSYARLQLLTAERAFAQAMAMKAAHASNKKGITGHTRSHIVSRLDKAAKYAAGLSDLLQDDASGASDVDRLEARAYAAMLRGAAAFEKQAWELCLANYAAVWAIYSALSSASPTRADIFRDLLAETIEPSLRYAAYQLKMPRSKPIPIVAREALLSATSVAATPDTSALVASVNQIDPAILQPKTAATADGIESLEAAAPGTVGGVVASTRTLTWRSREVKIEDAAIASAWAALDLAKARLEAQLVAGGARMAPKDKAAAYDDVLTVSQDAVDATKAAIDDLRNEGIPQSDPSVQLLYIARTAANYEMISDRIGRNRVLTGPHDGAVVQSAPVVTRKAKGKPAVARPEAPGRLLARLKEKLVLYDGTLQSLETVKELPGVAADVELAEQLDATAKYFVALKSLAVARSHALAGHAANALALVKYAHDQADAAAPVLAKAATGGARKATGSGQTQDSPLRSIHVSADDVAFLQALLQAELQRTRALVDIEKQQPAAGAAASKAGALALSETLGEYPPGAVDLDNIVSYPPRIQAVPVKPIFLDIAWNYIDYPSKAGSGAAAAVKSESSQQAAPTASGAPPPQQEQPQKRGWFGFKR